MTTASWDLWKRATRQRPPIEPAHPNLVGEAQNLIIYINRGYSVKLFGVATLGGRAVPNTEQYNHTNMRTTHTGIRITLTELKSRQLWPDAAAGTEKITYRMGRHTREVGHDEVLSINASYTTGFLRRALKEATIHPITKPRGPGKAWSIMLFDCIREIDGQWFSGVRRVLWTA